MSSRHLSLQLAVLFKPTVSDELHLSSAASYEDTAIENVTLESLAHTSLVLTLASLLREHLKQLYKLTDAYATFLVPPLLVN